ncbi:hypothetical protein FBY39_0666 [Microbacterium sp. SLBN-146]|nr:hypothetical protein FBY39_0666 [Microbacterium sp. SLBN-146]
MISPFEQTLLFATTIVILSGTLVVFAWQWWRNRGRDED